MDVLRRRSLTAGRLRLWLTCSTLLLALLVGPASASAYVRYGHKLKYGVGGWGASNQHYWVDSSASGYSATIDAAMSDWITTTKRLGITTPISYTRTTAKSSSRMDIYVVPSIAGAPSGAIAQTTWWTGSGEPVNPTASDWVWGKIRIISPVFSSLSAFNQKGTCSHEMGHVMGLGENNSVTNSCMCQLGSGRTVSNAQKDDANGINAVY